MIRTMLGIVATVLTAGCIQPIPARARRPNHRSAPLKADARTLGIAPIELTKRAFADKDATPLGDDAYLLNKGIFRCAKWPSRPKRAATDVMDALVEQLRASSGFANVVVVDDPKRANVDLLLTATLKRWDACVQIRRSDLSSAQQDLLASEESRTVEPEADLQWVNEALSAVFGLMGGEIGSLIEGSSDPRGSAYADIVLTDVTLVDTSRTDPPLWHHGVVEGRLRTRIIREPDPDLLTKPAFASTALEMQKRVRRVLDGESPTGLLPGGRKFRSAECSGCRAPTTAVVIAVTPDLVVTRKSLEKIGSTELPTGYPMVMHTDELGVLKDSIEGVATVIGLFADADDAATWTRRWRTRLPPMAMIPLRRRGWKPAPDARYVVHLTRDGPVPAFAPDALDQTVAASPTCTLEAGSFFLATPAHDNRDGWSPVRCGDDLAYVADTNVDQGACAKKCKK